MAHSRHRLTMTLSLALALGAAPAGQLPLSVRGLARRAIVMIKVESQTAAQTMRGAGLIVASSAEGVDIATAAHLIADMGSDLKVSVWFDADREQERWFDARVLPVSAELLDQTKRLDLAMIRTKLPEGIDAATLVGLGAASSRTLAPADAVYPMGFGNEDRWSLRETPDRVPERQDDSLRVFFESTTVQPGNSGGALLDQCGRIVGMVNVRSPTAAMGEAIRIERVLLAVGDLLRKAPTLELSVTPCAASSTINSNTTRSVAAEPPSCEVSVSSTPSDAEVFLDDRGEGVTPRRLSLTRGRVHQVRVEKDGYEPYSNQVDCSSGSVEASLRLRPITLVYRGDGECQPRLVVQIDNIRYPVTSSPYAFRIDGIPPGESRPYWIAGELNCRPSGFDRQPRRSCEVVAQDGYSIAIWPGGVYEITENYIRGDVCVAHLVSRP